MEAPQNRWSNALRAPAPPMKKQAYIYPIHTLEDINPHVSFVAKLWDVMASLWNIGAVLHILAVYVIFVVIPNVIPESFSEVPCRLPALPRHFPPRARELGHPRNLVATPDFITLTRLQSKLEYVMEDCARSSLVAVDMKDSEMALRDVGTLVRHSSISRKDVIGRDLRHFVEDAKATSESLQLFRHHVWGVVGGIVHENSLAITALENMSLETAGGSHSGRINLPMPFGRGKTPRRKRMEDLWPQAIRLLDTSLRKLIDEVQANIGSLQMLEIGLDNIQEMIDTEDNHIRSGEQGLKRRWFPDEEKLGPHSASFKLLSIAQDHREHALSHVIGALSKLKEMSRGLSDLRVGTSTAASPSNISIEAQIKSIQNVTERLEYGQTCMTKMIDAHRRGKFSDQPISIDFH